MYLGLNHHYRLIWNQALKCWVAVEEFPMSRSKGAGKLTKRCQTQQRLGLGRLRWVIAMLGLWPKLVLAGPEFTGVQQGIGHVRQQGHTTTITQQNQRLALNWRSFNIDSHETVNFIQPGREALAINYILDSNGSQIHGRLNANGQVWLVNPNGVLFGQQARVNVGGIVASSLALAGANDFNAQFRKDQTSGLVQNLGSIHTAEGGYIAFIGEQVSNHGQLSSTEGNVSLAAGSEVNLSFAGAQLLSLDILQSTLNNLADNQGLIQAEGGRVLMNAGAKDSILASVVNNDGVIEAKSVGEHKGEIILLAGMLAGTTTINGRLDASADTALAQGGFIETSGHQVNVDSRSHITTAAAAGNGQWLIDPNVFIIAPSGGDITGATLSNQLGSTNVEIQSVNGGSAGDGDIWVNDVINWAANTTLTLNAERDIKINRNIFSTGANGKLHLLYGQAAVAAGNSAEYTVNAAIKLRAGKNFSTKLGRDGSQINYTVITELGGEGSTTSTDLQGIQGNLAAPYALGADIDAGATTNWDSGKGFKPIGDNSNPFTGSLDGLGNTINGLSIQRSSSDNIGLIGRSLAPASIKNIGLTAVDIKGNDFTGGLIGFARGVVSNSYITGTVTGNDKVGGLIGSAYATVSNSYATASVTGNDSVGGLLGSLGGTPASSTNYSATTTGSNNGILSFFFFSNDGTVSNSYATGAATGSDKVGGLVGESFIGTQISKSYATGAATGSDKVGGLIGLSRSPIRNSYASGTVVGNSDLGGLIGSNLDTVSNSFWNKESSTQNHSSGSADSFGKTSAEMLQLDTFAGWDIDDLGGSGRVWRIYDSHTAPLLRSFLSLADNDMRSVDTSYNGQPQTYRFAAHLFSTSPISAASYTNAGTYVVNAADLYSNQQGYDIRSSDNATFKILAKAITLSASRAYDGTVSLLTNLLAITGLIGNDQLNFSGSATLASKNAGKQIINIDNLNLGNSNYQASGQHLALITPKLVSVLVTAADKVFDNTTVASINFANSTGILSGDQVKLTYGSAHFAQLLGNNLQVEVKDIALSGLDAANYILSAQTLFTTASISQITNTDNTRQALTNETGSGPTVELAALSIAGDGLNLLPATAAGGQRCSNFAAASVSDESTDDWAGALNIELAKEKVNAGCDDSENSEDKKPPNYRKDRADG